MARNPGTSDRIPRNRADDYAEAIVRERRDWAGKQAKADLSALGGGWADPRLFRGNIENMIGTVQIPVGLAGPFAIKGEAIEAPVFVPLATTEGALVASYSRGMKAISASGGARTRVVSAALTSGVSFLFDDQSAAHAFAAWLGRQETELRRLAEATTRHGRLLAVEPRALGRRVLVNFVYDTADALGINMATAASAAASDWIMQAAQPRPKSCNLPGGLQGEKWANALDFIRGRGRRVAADAVITRDVLNAQLHAEASAMQDAWLTMTLAKTQAAGLGMSFHAANGATALMLATGQDLAYVAAFSAIALMEARQNGDLYLSIDIPTLGVGTVGGGTGLPGPSACLAIMGCAGAGRANRLAEIIAATCLAGEASTVAAIVSGEFLAAHESLGRNRPRA